MSEETELYSTKPSIRNTVGRLLKNKIVQRAGGVFFFRLCYVALNFIIALLLGRLIGPEGLGAYSFATSTVQVLLILTVFGLPHLVIREIAVYNAQANWGMFRRLLLWCNKIVVLSSILFSFVGIALAIVLRHSDPILSRAFFISLFALPFLAQIRLRQSVMQGVNKVVLGYLPEFLIQPSLIIFILVVTAFFFDGFLSTGIALLGYDCSIIISFFIGLFLFLRTLPKEMRMYNAKHYDTKAWFKSTMILFLFVAMGAINTKMDFIMLGTLKGAEAVGVYTAANKFAALIYFGMMAINVAERPSISADYAKGDLVKIQKALTMSSVGGLAIALPIVILYIFFGKFFLGFFGSEFLVSYTPLLLLSVGMLINNTAGSVGVVLVGCNLEKEAAISVAVGAGVNILLNLVLIPVLNVEGAAIATGTSMIVWNIAMSIYITKKLHLRVGPIQLITKSNLKIDL